MNCESRYFLSARGWARDEPVSTGQMWQVRSFLFGKVHLTPLKFTSCRNLNKSIFKKKVKISHVLAKSSLQTIPWNTNLGSFTVNSVSHTGRQIHLSALLGCQPAFFKGLSHERSLGKNFFKSPDYECCNVWIHSNYFDKHFIYYFGQKN